MVTEQTRHAHYNINDHLVWCPKFRRPVLEGAVGQRLAELIPPEVGTAGVVSAQTIQRYIQAQRRS